MSEGLELRSVAPLSSRGQPMYAPLTVTVAPGEVLAVIGPSGVGKSSLLHLISGTLDDALGQSGEVWLDGRCIDRLAPEQRGVGLVLQRDYLFPHMNVQENLLFGLRGGRRHQRLERVSRALEQAALAGFGERRVQTLSGGQRARVSLLRTLLSQPRVLLLDEAFASLDTELRAQQRRFTFAEAAALPVLIVSHDPEDIPPGAACITLEPIDA